MKTFEEAAGICIRLHPETEPEAADKRARAEMKDLHERNAAICAEIVESPLTHLLAEDLVTGTIRAAARRQGVAEDSNLVDITVEDIHGMVVSAIVNGVLIGKEMERQELPKIAE